jgi:hypothetical protein
MKKVLIFVIILTIILSVLIFKPFPAKSMTTWNFSSPFTSISINSSTTQYLFQLYYGSRNSTTSGLVYTSNLDISISLYDFNTNAYIGSYIYSVHTTTEKNILTTDSNVVYVYDNGAGYIWKVNIPISNFTLQVSKTYSITISITGYTRGLSGFNEYWANWNINMSAYFLLTKIDGTILPLNPKDVSLSFQSYDCQTHIATFGVNIQGYSSIDFSKVSTLGKMGKEYIVSYFYDKTNQLLKVYFTSDLPTGNIILSLGITCDNTLSLLKDISFTNTCSVQQQIQAGKLYITSPPAEVKYTSPQVGGDYYSVSFSFAYGGDIIHDFGSDWGMGNVLGGNIFTSSVKVQGGVGYSLIGISSSGIGVMFQDGYAYNVSSNIQWTYDSNNNVSYLTINIPLIKDYQPDLKADINISFELTGNGLKVQSENSVHIVIGEAINSTGNPILDFLIKVWSEFKDWFVNTMKFLFVPTASDISQQLQTGWIDVRNTQLLPNVSSSRYLSVSMPKSLFGDNNTVNIDFGKMTEWAGWSNVRTITRGLIWLVFAYILISLVV